MAARCMKIRIADGLPVEETAVVRKEDREKADALIKKLQDELIGNALRAMVKHPGRWDEVEGVREVLGPRFKDRPGGYCRIIKLAKRRLGDNGERAILEFVERTPREDAAPADAE